jgi:hypothetical protein
MFDFGTSTGQALYQRRTNIETSSEQALVRINKHIQTIENNKNLNKPKNLKNFISKNSETEHKQESTVPYQDNLKTSSDKNYNEPL